MAVRMHIALVRWGFLLWLVGYILGFVFYAFVPQEMLGWYIMPFGIIATVWVLLRKITTKTDYEDFVVGVSWAILAIVLDYVFLVQLLRAENYYKLDVYMYYVFTFLLPLGVGGCRRFVQSHRA